MRRFYLFSSETKVDDVGSFSYFNLFFSFTYAPLVDAFSALFGRSLIIIVLGCFPLSLLLLLLLCGSALIFTASILLYTSRSALLGSVLLRSATVSVLLYTAAVVD
ncbi:hypothetical protein SOVF_058620 [Spinacia oleracea]|nr:hypothetical protein SOVF_058620 [Spinacia oleracea]